MKKLLALLVLLGSAPVWAVTADDLDCVKCVGTSELNKAAVGTGKIKNNAVTAQKIKNGAVTEQKIQNGAVTVSKVAPQLSNSLDTYCLPGQSVYGMNASGNFLCEQTGVYNTKYEFVAGGSVGGSCLVDQVLSGISCSCDPANSLTTNLGVVAICDIIGNGGVAGCLFESSTFDPFKNIPRARLDIVCANQDPLFSAAAVEEGPISESAANDEIDIAAQAAMDKLIYQQSFLQGQ